MLPVGYDKWLESLKTSIQVAQSRAAMSVNKELISLYWKVGRDILERQEQQGWGAKVIDQLSVDLKNSFPSLKGFSSRNLKYMRKFAEAWPDPEFVQQPAAQLPWFHICTVLDKVKDPEIRLWYMIKASEFGWSRTVLVHQIESRLIEREGNATTNFAKNLPEKQSELAQQTLKDPYIFDFLSLGAEAKERDIENALTEHISKFLLELGSGFAYVGKQVHLEVGGEDFYLDLLFYHLKLRCYVVIELKTGDFKPEHTGQLNFYLSAVDSQIKSEQDHPSIGLLLCKSQNRIVAEYALRDNSKPIGIAEYQIEQALPEEFEKQLPSIETIENILQEDKKD
ncbi:MAG: DUF1016 domain-containing protein [Oleiphilus sp.]|nr:MAG: DUF1016 domain-containing protein [Oleiphilus sp.]